MALAAAVAAVAMLTGSMVDAAEQPCTEGSRECVIATATTYLDALVSHDSASVRLAPDAWRMGNGRVDARGEDELRAVIEREPVAAIHGARWVVEDEDAIAVYDLDADFSRSAQSETFGPEDTQVPAYVIERFKVRDGLIHEIEVVYWGDAGRGERPERPDRGVAGAPVQSRDVVVDAAGKYLAALVSHDGSDVPLAEDAWRLENGGNSGDSGEEIRAGLESPIMSVITEMGDVRWFVEGEQAVAIYRIWTDGTALVGEPRGPDPSRNPTFIAERFRVQNGLIKEIEAVFWIGPPGVPPDERPS